MKKVRIQTENEEILKRNKVSYTGPFQVSVSAPAPIHIKPCACSSCEAYMNSSHSPIKMMYRSVEMSEEDAYNILSKWGWDGKRRAIVERNILH